MRLSISEWDALERICSEEKLTRNKLIEIIESNNKAQLGLTYMTRLFTLYYYYSLATKPQEASDADRGNEKILRLLNELYLAKSERL